MGIPLWYRTAESSNIASSNTVVEAGLTNAQIDGNFKALNENKVDSSSVNQSTTPSTIVQRDSNSSIFANSAILSTVGLGPTTTTSINVSSSTGSTNILSFNATTYRSAEVTIQATQSSDYEITKFLITGLNSNVYLEEYAKIGSSPILGISATISNNIITVTASTATVATSFKGSCLLIQA